MSDDKKKPQLNNEKQFFSVKTPLTSKDFFLPKDIRSIMMIDAMSLCDPERKEEYCKSNQPTYYLVCNLWLMKLSTYCSDQVLFGFRVSLLRDGLVAVIGYCNDWCSSWIRYINQDTDEIEYDGVLTGLLSLLVHDVHCSTSTDDEFLRVVLELTRFAKRFSPALATRISESSEQQFLSMEKRTKWWNRKDLTGFYLIPRMREIIREVLRTAKPNTGNGFFSEGSAYIASKGVSSKSLGLKVLDSIGDYDILPLEYTVLPVSPYRKVVKIASVPKSYKAARIIGMERPCANYHGQSLRLQLEDLIERSKYSSALDARGQDNNRHSCALGSLDGDLATIDLSSASDSIPWSLVSAIFPNDWARALYEVRPVKFMLNGKEKTLQMAFTSGHPCTFVVEKLIFFAIDLAATEVAACLLNRKFKIGQDIVVYGDDQIVPAWAAETVISALEALGFIVNIDKSYYTGLYRESCGVEFYGGIEIGSRYFPRICFQWDKPAECYNALVALQHQMLMKPSYNWFLTSFIGRLVEFSGKKLTVSRPGSQPEPVDVISDVLDLPDVTHCKRPGKIVTEQINLNQRTVEAAWRDITRPYRDTFWYQRGACKDSFRIPLGITPGEKGLATVRYLQWCRLEVNSSGTQYHAVPLRTADPSYDGVPHLYGKSIKRQTRKLSELESEQLSLFLYQEFLKSGPKFEDPLLELLGCSSKPTTVDDLIAEPSIAWGYYLDR